MSNYIPIFNPPKLFKINRADKFNYLSGPLKGESGYCLGLDVTNHPGNFRIVKEEFEHSNLLKKNYDKNTHPFILPGITILKGSEDQKKYLNNFESLLHKNGINDFKKIEGSYLKLSMTTFFPKFPSKKLVEFQAPSGTNMELILN